MFWLACTSMALSGTLYVILGLLAVEAFKIPLWPAHYQYTSIFRFTVPASDEEGNQTPVSDIRKRLLGYTLILIGFCRLLSSMYWGCGYVHIGIMTCLLEICMLSWELAWQESVVLNRGLVVLLSNVALVILYVCNFLPTCT